MNPENQPQQPNPMPQDAPQNIPQEPLQPPVNPQPVPLQPPAPASPEVPPTSVGMDQPVAPPPSMTQSQPPVNPMAPGVPPAGPIMGSAPNQPTPPSNPLSGLNKKLLMWIGIGVGALAVVVIAIIVIVGLFSVSQADYKAAYDYANDARTSYAKMSGVAYVSAYSTDTESENNLDTFKKSQKSFNEAVEALGKTKAVQRDGKASELYKAMADKKQSFDKAAATLIETYEYILPAMADFNGASSSNLSKLAKAVDTARSKLESSEGDIKSAVNKEFANKLVTLFKKYSTLLKKVDAYRDDYTKYDSKVANDFSDTSTEITTVIRNWSSDITKVTEDADVASEFNELGEYLAGKSVS